MSVQLIISIKREERERKRRRERERQRERERGREIFAPVSRLISMTRTWFADHYNGIFFSLEKKCLL